MSVWKQKDCRTYRYSFQFKGRRFEGNTGKTTKVDAEKVEREQRDAARLAHAQRKTGIVLPGTTLTPRFSDWADEYYAHAAKRLTRPDRVEILLRVVLRFWGEKPSGKNPKNPIIDGEPYRDLRLGDAIANPQLIADFEDWMDARGIRGQTKNQYRSVVRQMYQLALQPRWRVKTGIQVNPMDGIYRDRGGSRKVTINPDDMRKMLQHASYHVRLAIAIGALAPELRLSSILALQWGVHVDEPLRFITVYEHKTAGETGTPQVMPITEQLRVILLDARRRSSGKRGGFVVTYRGRPLKQITDGMRGAAEAAGIPYGRFKDDGATFHSLRHTAATILAERDVSEAKRKNVMGHKRLDTTQGYTHLRPVHKVEPLELLSATLPISDLVTQPWRRASRRPERIPERITTENAETPEEATGVVSTLVGSRN